MRFVERRSDSPAELDRDALTECLREYPVSMAVLFGSQAAGPTHGLSDLDVAVLFNKGASKERKRRLLDELTVSITDATGFEAIDVVDLAAVGPELGYEVLSEGTVLLGDKDEIVEFEAELLVRKLDFAPVKTEWIAALDERIEDGTYGRA
jgi:predicted nucleotidyltransferase